MSTRYNVDRQLVHVAHIRTSRLLKKAEVLTYRIRQHQYWAKFNFTFVIGASLAEDAMRYPDASEEAKEQVCPE